MTSIGFYRSRAGTIDTDEDCDNVSDNKSNIETINKPAMLGVYPEGPHQGTRIGRHLTSVNRLFIQHSHKLEGSYISPISLAYDHFIESGDNYSVFCVSENEIDLKIFYLDGIWKITRRTETLKAYIVYTIDKYGRKKKQGINSGENIDLMQGNTNIEIHIEQKNSKNILQIIHIVLD